MAEMTWHQAIQHVLRENGSAMHCGEITDRIVELKLRQNLGATPEATVGAHCYNSLNRDDVASPYVKVDKATFALREALNTAAEQRAAATASEAGTLRRHDRKQSVEDENGLIQAFGMYWQRDMVHWCSTPAIGGRQQIGATVVNFAEQRGVYLLNDGREVVYVGRVTDRGIGRRLFEHTQDQLRSRWNRFSWFGLRRVTEQGELEEVTYTPSEELIAATLEALLIEGLEPRQNRRRGDGFTAVEYLQAEDPEIERQRMKALLESVKQKF